MPAQTPERELRRQRPFELAEARSGELTFERLAGEGMVGLNAPKRPQRSLAPGRGDGLLDGGILRGFSPLCFDSMSVPPTGERHQAQHLRERHRRCGDVSQRGGAEH